MTIIIIVKMVTPKQKNMNNKDKNGKENDSKSILFQTLFNTHNNSTIALIKRKSLNQFKKTMSN